MNKQQPAPTVELVKSRYQPSKSELEADVRPDVERPITLETLSRMTANLVKTVNIRWVTRP